MTDLPGLESTLQDSLQDDIETATEEMGEALKDEAEANFREYAGRQGYDIDHIWQQASVGGVSSGPGRASVTVEWPGLTALFEWGVSPHTISGNPLLKFYWDAKDTWVVTEEVNWGSETGGIPESRAIRGALNYIRLQYERSVNL
jgi:hypothetical protein